MEMDIRSRKKSLKDKSRMKISLRENISRNERNKGNNDRDKFGYKIPNNYREALLLDKNNGNTLWAYEISKDMTTLEKLGVFQYICLKLSFRRKMIGNTRQYI